MSNVFVEEKLVDAEEQQYNHKSVNIEMTWKIWERNTYRYPTDICSRLLRFANTAFTLYMTHHGVTTAEVVVYWRFKEDHIIFLKWTSSFCEAYPFSCCSFIGVNWCPSTTPGKKSALSCTFSLCDKAEYMWEYSYLVSRLFPYRHNSATRTTNAQTEILTRC